MFYTGRRKLFFTAGVLFICRRIKVGPPFKAISLCLYLSICVIAIQPYRCRCVCDVLYVICYMKSNHKPIDS